MSRLLITLAVIGLATAGAHARQAILPGKVRVSNAEVIPPGTTLVVTLRDLSMGIAKEATVARAGFEAQGKTPIRFDLPYVESTVEEGRIYGVSAVITDARGKPLWESPIPIRVLTLGNQKSVELLLRPAKTPKAEPAPTAFALDCGAAHFDVTVDGRGAATISGADNKYVLPRVEAPSGRKFSDGLTTLSVVGQAVYLQLPNRAYRDCKLSEAP